MKIQETGHESVLIVLSLYSFPLILRLELEQTCIIMYKQHKILEDLEIEQFSSDFSNVLPAQIQLDHSILATAIISKQQRSIQRSDSSVI